MTVAHLNWAYLRAPWGDPRVAEFCDNVDRVNRAAARSPGFVARPDFDETALYGLVQVSDGPFDPERMAATLSIWETPEHLERYVHRTVHGRFLKRRADWFVPQGVPNYVVWPIADRHVPDAAEAVERMRMLWARGPTKDGYDFRWLRAQAA